ncbi:hypothetical protein FISHEDRAFT_70055 [Fistulina hepatica ATCC 64428]|uniref:Uncharacterized protein n=1 Tax=Fistulina hepatica ATCC 64428 TaxID=1128425 RepID=A0A0D7AJR4_9AGAR|nr:hypothetical protein FISHEDRAFT_70055 [Fistulina hepatica ATCC 64428]
MAFVPTDVSFPSLLQYTNSQLHDMEDFEVLLTGLELAATISSYNHSRMQHTVAVRQFIQLLALHPLFAQGPIAIELVAWLHQEAAWAGPLLSDDTPAAPVVPSITLPQAMVSIATELVPDAPISISGSSAEEEVVCAHTTSPHAMSLADLATVVATLADPIAVPAIVKANSPKDDSSSSCETSLHTSHASDSEESEDSLVGHLSYLHVKIPCDWAIVQNRNLRLNHCHCALCSATALINLEHPDD